MTINPKDAKAKPAAKKKAAKGAPKPESDSIKPVNHPQPEPAGEPVEKERLFWADALAKELVAATPQQVVSDAKTPSGEIHVGALRGVILHDIAYKALLDAGAEVEYVYRFDDFDPMDSVPEELAQRFSGFMGKPLCDIPSPMEGYKSYAECYASRFKDVFNKLGCNPRIVWSSHDYKNGKFNSLIRTALENSEQIRKINETVSGGKKTSNWLPIHVLCESCGRIGTTQASDFDGKTVAYHCAGSTYVKGCGHDGRRSPFDGGSKLTWKVQWAAQFKLYGVTVEGAGKDHYTTGGSHEVASLLCKKIFDYPVPEGIPYEFFLVGGKKMSTSKGTGSTAVEIAQLVSPQIIRFLIARYKPRTAINFSPYADTIPKLYDDYDWFAEAYFKRKVSRDPDEPRIYSFSQVSEDQRLKPTDCWKPSFSLVAYLMQVPHVQIEQAMAKAKGAALTQMETAELKEREAAARAWLDNYADDSEKLSLLPQAEGVRAFYSLTKEQQNALAEFADYLSVETNQAKQAEKVREISSKYGVSVKDFFQAAYSILVGRSQGPRLLPFLAALDRQFVVQRLKGVL
jgi:lysyl-tRNA synthetase class 1